MSDTERMATALERIVYLLEHHLGAQPVAPAPYVAPQPAYVAPNAPVAAVATVNCPYHHKELKPGRFGLFCSGQGGNGPLNARGYCNWTPTAAA